jgi:hypothetical protein
MIEANITVVQAYVCPSGSIYLDLAPSQFHMHRCLTVLIRRKGDQLQVLISYSLISNYSLSLSIRSSILQLYYQNSSWDLIKQVRCDESNLHVTIQGRRVFPVCTVKGNVKKEQLHIL